MMIEIHEKTQFNNHRHMRIHDDGCHEKTLTNSHVKYRNAERHEILRENTMKWT